MDWVGKQNCENGKLSSQAKRGALCFYVDTLDRPGYLDVAVALIKTTLGSQGKMSMVLCLVLVDTERRTR